MHLWRFRALAVLAAVGVLFAVPAADTQASAPALNWTAPAAFDFGNHVHTRGIRSFACDPLASLCVAGDFNGDVVASADPTGDASKWTVTNVAGNTVTALSCPSASLCAGVDGNNGDVITSTDPTGGDGAWNVTNIGGFDLLGISCPTTSFCVAVDFFGNIVTSNDPTGDSSKWVATQTTPLYTGISCPVDRPDRGRRGLDDVERRRHERLDVDLVPLDRALCRGGRQRQRRHVDQPW